MMEEQPQPPPVVLPQPKERVVEQKPVEKPEPERLAKAEEPKPAPADVPAPEQGILAFREKLAQIKESPLVALGAQARINNSNANSAARPERSMLTTNAPGSSGGIRLAALSRDFGADGGGVRGPMQGAALTRASSNIDAIGPGERPLSDGPGLARTDEEIQIVFDRYKSALYRLYNRELRRDPTLQGQMVLRLTIEPNGSVSFCQLQATDMRAPELVTQVVDRVRTFDFGAKEVPAITIVYPIDFLPAA
jgi:outer membrane biosynthesis protein TonB